MYENWNNLLYDLGYNQRPPINFLKHSLYIQICPAYQGVQSPIQWSPPQLWPEISVLPLVRRACFLSLSLESELRYAPWRLGDSKTACTTWSWLPQHNTLLCEHHGQWQSLIDTDDAETVLRDLPLAVQACLKHMARPESPALDPATVTDASVCPCCRGFLGSQSELLRQGCAQQKIALPWGQGQSGCSITAGGKGGDGVLFLHPHLGMPLLL